MQHMYSSCFLWVKFEKCKAHTIHVCSGYQCIKGVTNFKRLLFEFLPVKTLTSHLLNHHCTHIYITKTALSGAVSNKGLLKLK